MKILDVSIFKKLLNDRLSPDSSDWVKEGLLQKIGLTTAIKRKQLIKINNIFKKNKLQVFIFLRINQVILNFN